MRIVRFSMFYSLLDSPNTLYQIRTTFDIISRNILVIIPDLCKQQPRNTRYSIVYSMNREVSFETEDYCVRSIILTFIICSVKNQDHFFVIQFMVFVNCLYITFGDVENSYLILIEPTRLRTYFPENKFVRYSGYREVAKID